MTPGSPATRQAPQAPAPRRAPVVHDLRLAPVAVAAWSAAWWSTGSSAATVLTVTVLALLAAVAGLAAVALGRALAAGGHRRTAHGGRTEQLGLALSACAAVVAAACAGTAHHLERRESPAVLEVARGGAVDAVLRVRGDPVAVDGPVWQQDRVRVRAVLEAVDGARVPAVPVSVTGGQEWREVRWGQRVGTGLRGDPAPAGAPVALFTSATGPPTPVAAAPPVWRAAERVRSGLVGASAADGTSDGAGLLPGLVVGDTSLQPPGLADDMRAAGLTHLTAVSGSNVTIVCGGTLLAALLLGAGRRTGAVLAALALVGLVVVARPDPSVLRAAVMGVVGLLGVALGRRGGGVPALAVAVTAVVLLDPWLARAPGFRLSVVATGALVLAAGPLARLLGRTLPRAVALAVSVPAVAQAAVTPVLLGLEPVVPLYALPANVLAAPAVAPATVLGVLAALVSVVHPGLAAVLAVPARWCAAWVAAVARTVADLPHALLPWPAGGTGVVLGAVAAAAVTAAGVAALRWLPDRRPPREGWAPWPSRAPALRAAVVLGLLGALLLPGTLPGLSGVPGLGGALRAGGPGWPGLGWPVVVCDVGQGDSLLVRTSEHAAVVVDTGPDTTGLERCLGAARVQHVDLLVLTHLHADHVGGIDGLTAGGRTVGEVWTATHGQPAAVLADLQDWAERHRVPVATPAAGDRRALAGAAVEVLAPAVPTAATTRLPVGTSQDVNDAGLVVRVTAADGTRVLSVGDLGARAQERLLRSGTDVAADVTTVAHHGSADQLPAFYRRVGAQVAVASAGADNPYGHPSPRGLAVVADSGSHVLTTPVAGAVAVRHTGGGALAVRTARRQRRASCRSGRPRHRVVPP